MSELKQIVRHLLGARAVITCSVVKLPLIEIVVHDHRRILPRGEVCQEVVPVICAEAKYAIDIAALEDLDVFSFLDEVRFCLLEHDLVAKLSGTVADAADEFAEVG